MSDPVISKQDQEILKEAEAIIEIADKEIKQKKKTIKLLWLVIPILIIACIFFTLSTIFAILNRDSNLIVNGISIQGVDVSGLTKEEAQEKITNVFASSLGADVTLLHNGEEIKLSPADIYASFDIEGAVELAYQIGRTGNIFKQNYEIVAAFASNYNILPGFSYAPQLLEEKVTQIEENLPDFVIQPSYFVENNELKIQNGKSGVVVDHKALSDQIIYTLHNLENETAQIEIPTIATEPNVINIDEIYKEVYKAAVDAHYTKEPMAVYPSSTGIDFNISIEEAKTMLAEPKDEYIIPLKVVYPEVTTNDLPAEAFPDLLATYTTRFSTSNYNRSTNIRLAVQKINGVVLMPGESFSYNEVVGKRTVARGFKVAAVYSNGEVSQGVGGGICQVSSTLYNSVLLSNLEVTERRNHTFNTGYVPAGQDATVSWGGPDFKFKNNRNYPIRIVSSVSGGSVTTQIYGLKQDTDYDVKVTSSVIGSIPYKITYKNDDTLGPGETKVLQKGSNGLRSVTYQIFYSNGTEVSRREISRDTYSPHNQVVARGV